MLISLLYFLQVRPFFCILSLEKILIAITFNGGITMHRKTLLMSALILTLLFTFSLPILAQDSEQAENKDAYQFTNTIVLDHTPVKSQGRTGTCWS